MALNFEIDFYQIFLIVFIKRIDQKLISIKLELIFDLSKLKDEIICF